MECQSSQSKFNGILDTKNVKDSVPTDDNCLVDLFYLLFYTIFQAYFSESTYIYRVWLQEF